MHRAAPSVSDGVAAVGCAGSCPHPRALDHDLPAVVAHDLGGDGQPQAGPADLVVKNGSPRGPRPRAASPRRCPPRPARRAPRKPRRRKASCRPPGMACKALRTTLTSAWKIRSRRPAAGGVLRGADAAVTSASSISMRISSRSSLATRRRFSGGGPAARAGEVQHLAHDASRRRTSLTMICSDSAPRLLRGRVAQQGAGEAPDGHQGIADLVGHPRRHLPDRGEALAPQHPLLVVLERAGQPRVRSMAEARLDGQQLQVLDVLVIDGR